jgi:hypothetical protein
MATNILNKLYPAARKERLSIHHPTVLPRRRQFIRAAALNFLYLQVLFFSLFAYIFGSLYQQAGHTHNMRMLFVDYDTNGFVGEAVRNAYDQLKGDNFPTIVEKSPSEFEGGAAQLRDEVCHLHYWATLYTSAGASGRIDAALRGGEAATGFNEEDVLTFAWNEARYSAVVDSVVQGNLQTLSLTAQRAWVKTNGTDIAKTLNTSDPAAVSIFTDPWTLKSVNIQPTTQGSRLIYNTLVIILILIQEFFYLGTINALYGQLKIYASVSPHRIIIYRNIISILYTFSGSLCTTGAIWAFRSGWQVSAGQFVLSWMVLWLFAHVNFVTLDVFTIWIPVTFVPMALISWIVMNVTSILLPFELSPGFYQWAYMLPAHEVYQVLTDVWSRGCNPQLRHALPVLFGLELSGLLITALGVYRRCHYAILAEEAQEKNFQDKLDTALAHEKKRMLEKERQTAGRDRKYDIPTTQPAEPGETIKPQRSKTEEEAEPTQKLESDAESSQKDREELEAQIEKENTAYRQQQEEIGRAVNFGPHFDLGFLAHDGQNFMSRSMSRMSRKSGGTGATSKE